ncbi:MAG TPA: hypothetical protein VFI91_11625 [Longimicrobiaceae bacterium]|nr:hypothetical protein [Longimicrobiaceae bacterium]
MDTDIRSRTALPSVRRYFAHLDATAGWLQRSIFHGRGGSCAHFSHVAGWSKPYPETTGYLIPTLLHLHSLFPARCLHQDALATGRWLLSIQGREGSWAGGLHPPRGNGRPSIFNTGQILKGMIALYNFTEDQEWLDAATRGAAWLARGVGNNGLWEGGDYRAQDTPSYYTHVVWPMLEVWSCAGDDKVRDAAVSVLDRIVDRRLPNGVIQGWGFAEDEPAFTHTIAYTLRGILESARLLNAWDRYSHAAVPALEVLIRRSELAGGRLPGAFDANWQRDGNYVCLTGNAQVAICVLLMESRSPDLRLVSAAARMVDYVCSTQRLRSPVAGVRGAVAGSAPVWGPYMRLRYPNWAAKYLCDALLRLIERVEREAVA